MIVRNSLRSFKLEIIGYESMTSDVVEDLNWLEIKISAKDEKREWSAQGPYLRTFDLIDMHEWFNNLKERKEVVNRLGFMEHELSLEYDEKQNDLVINLDFDLHPKGDGYDFDKDSEYKIRFDLSKIDIDSILVSLNGFISDFPIRAYNGSETIN